MFFFISPGPGFYTVCSRSASLLIGAHTSLVRSCARVYAGKGVTMINRTSVYLTTRAEKLKFRQMYRSSSLKIEP